ncbi:antitoxin [Candidatus Poriferisocius sp.]|uniref:antitoxin n=1 Tax=Candidatus Poriferisocius sp. TaxID=3101276 RepID=UPI003B01EA20
MRTTVTLEDDTEQIIRHRMAQNRVSFKQALNDLVREGHAGTGLSQEFRTRTAPMGIPTINLDKALMFAGELEDDELIRRMEIGS